jgi:hypothetical protein
VPRALQGVAEHRTQRVLVFDEEDLSGSHAGE